MRLSNIVIVLDNPDESRNVGAACRAMANNDVSDLRIVGKKENYDAERVRVLAIHAENIFANARFFNSISEAVADCSICAGTTRRRGKKRGKLILPEEFADFANVNSETSKVAIVFGNERTGLTDSQLAECNVAVTIPSSQNFGSLNLSHAVQIFCYHLFRKAGAQKNNFTSGYEPVSLERIDKVVQNIANDMQKIGFFKMPGRENAENFWRGILSRANLSEGEAKYIEKTFSKIAGLSQKNLIK